MSLPDSPDLFTRIWQHRDQLIGFAHTHPGTSICPFPSYEDVTTFAAIEAALGRRWLWWIVDAEAVSLSRWGGRFRLDYYTERVSEPYWVEALRKESGTADWLPPPTVADFIRRGREAGQDAFGLANDPEAPGNEKG